MSDALKAENERLRKALVDIAKQKQDDEMTRDEYDVEDFIGNYNECIRVARAALQGDQR